jgi:hypothetical protein
MDVKSELNFDAVACDPGAAAVVSETYADTQQNEAVSETYAATQQNESLSQDSLIQMATADIYQEDAQPNFCQENAQPATMSFSQPGFAAVGYAASSSCASSFGFGDHRSNNESNREYVPACFLQGLCA